MGRYKPGTWQLDFHDSARPFASLEGLLPEAGDLVARARRNGAREGTPYFLRPDGRADARINRFWRAPEIRRLQEGTLRRYAFSLKVWLNFLECCDVVWDQAGPAALEAFKEWRMWSEDADCHVQAGTFELDIAAIYRFYKWAATYYGPIENPVRLRGTKKEASPSGLNPADQLWLTPEGYRQWRDVGLRGFTADGLPAEGWEGCNEDRDVAFIEGLYGTGVRCGEWSSLLTLEVPELSGRRMHTCWLAAQCTKRHVGRRYWVPARVVRAVRFYLEEGSRCAAVARAQRAGLYEAMTDRWLLEGTRGDRLLFRDQAGQLHHARLDELTPRRRLRLFRQTDAGLEPLALWLNQDGRPRSKKPWTKTFDRANARVLRVLGPNHVGRPRWWARPHMLRHSFALRWYCITTFVKWQQETGLTEAEQRDRRNELGSVWYLMATLLGHASPETTENVYLEPFQAVQVEQLLARMDGEDRAALEQLANTLAYHPRVQSMEAA